MVKTRARLAYAAIAVLAAVTIAACGSSSSSSSSSTSSAAATSSSAATSSAAAGTGTAAAPATNTSFTPTGSGGLKLIGTAAPQNAEATDPLGVKAQTGPVQVTAIKAGEAQAVKIGPGTIPKGSTVGLEEIINSVPSAQRPVGQFAYALRELGVNVIPCDGAGDPTKMNNCMTTLVAQKPKVIVSLATDPSLIAQGLQAAKAAKIPVMVFAGAVAPSPLWYREYYNDDKYAGQVLAKYVVDSLKAKGGSVWVSNYPSGWAAQRTDGLNAAVKGTNVKIAAETTVDSTNPIAGTQQQVVTAYTQNPKTSAYWFAYDAPGAAGAQALAAKDGGKAYPEGPLVVTFHDDQQANGLLRKGQLTAVEDESYDASSFETADAVAQYLAGKPVPPSDTTIHTPYEGHQMTSYTLITKANNPPLGEWPKPKFDYVSYFTAKWHKEFGLNP